MKATFKQRLEIAARAACKAIGLDPDARGQSTAREPRM